MSIVKKKQHIVSLKPQQKKVKKQTEMKIYSKEGIIISDFSAADSSLSENKLKKKIPCYFYSVMAKGILQRKLAMITSFRERERFLILISFRKLAFLQLQRGRCHGCRTFK